MPTYGHYTGFCDGCTKPDEFKRARYRYLLCQGDIPLNVSELVAWAHNVACEKGFWDQESEALEVHRNTTVPDCQRSWKMAEKLADIVIRVADLAGFLGLDLEEAIVHKMFRNETRPHRHGKRY